MKILRYLFSSPCLILFLASLLPLFVSSLYLSPLLLSLYLSFSLVSLYLSLSLSLFNTPETQLPRNPSCLYLHRLSQSPSHNRIICPNQPKTLQTLFASTELLASPPLRTTMPPSTTASGLPSPCSYRQPCHPQTRHPTIPHHLPQPNPPSSPSSPASAPSSSRPPATQPSASHHPRPPDAAKFQPQTLLSTAKSPPLSSAASPAVGHATVETTASTVIFPSKPTFSSIQLPPHEPPSSTAAGRRPSHGRNASTHGSVNRRPSRSPPPSSSLFSSPTAGYVIGSRATTLSSVPIAAGLPGRKSIVDFLRPSEALSTFHR